MSQPHACAAVVPLNAAPPAPPSSVWLSSYSHSYPGTADQVSLARGALRKFLASWPRLDDAVSVGGELANNAVLHSRSGLPGGVYTLHAAVSRSVGVTYVAVADAGGPWDRRGEVVRRHGLDVVEALAGLGNWGVNGSEDGWLVWAYLLWPGPFPRDRGELKTLLAANGDDPGDDLRKLARALDSHGLAAELMTPAGQVPHLAVHVADRPELAVAIYAQADWFFLPTADRLALRDEEARAAEAIARYLGVCDGAGDD
jgi:serine/threonine-protein kinase RsbW